MAKISKEKVAQRIWDNYGDRVSQVGGYAGRQISLTMYCHDCGNFFRQKAESLFRGYATRCSCSWKSRIKENRTGNHTNGHQIVQPWDAEAMGLEVPPRGKPNVVENKKSQQWF